MSVAALVARYALFALLATAVNLGTQRACLALVPALPPAMAAGTAAGLVFKFVLDKHWIFHAAAAGPRKLGLYTLTGVATTALFWLTELAFAVLFAAPLTGAALGLAAGYAAKYRLDRRFVFG